MTGFPWGERSAAWLGSLAGCCAAAWAAAPCSSGLAVACATLRFSFSRSMQAFGYRLLKNVYCKSASTDMPLTSYVSLAVPGEEAEGARAA